MALAEAAHFDCAAVKNNQQGAEVKILNGAGLRGETFARPVHRKGAKFADLEQFLKVLQTRYSNIPVYCVCVKLHTIQQANKSDGS